MVQIDVFRITIPIMVFVTALENFALLLYLLRKCENVRITLTEGWVGAGEAEFVVVRA
jgi:hypothetical protein